MSGASQPQEREGRGGREKVGARTDVARAVLDREGELGDKDDKEEGEGDVGHDSHGIVRVVGPHAGRAHIDGHGGQVMGREGQGALVRRGWWLLRLQGVVACETRAAQGGGKHQRWAHAVNAKARRASMQTHSAGGRRVAQGE